MSSEALVRFLVLGVLCCTLALTVNGEDSNSSNLKEEEQMKERLADDSEERRAHPRCSPAPQCPEGFGLLKSDERNEDGCSLFQCVHPVPETRHVASTSVRQVGSQCATPTCGVGYKSKARVFPKPLVGCPMYFCEPNNASYKKKWSKCAVSANNLETFDGKGSSCVKPCDVILVKDAFGFWQVRLTKTCRGSSCTARIRVFLKHGSLLGGNSYNITIRSNLKVKVHYNYPKISGTLFYQPTETRLIGNKFPFGATVSGDTIIFDTGGWGIRIVWNKNMEGSVRVKFNMLWQVYGACNFFSGMGPYGGKGGQVAKTAAQHIKSWSPIDKKGKRGCKPKKCNKKTEAKAWAICEMIRDKPFSRCKNVMDTCNYPAQCKDTVCQCLTSGKKEKICMCNALQSFTKKCLAAKSSLQPLLQEGLENKKCVPRCPEGMTYVYCRKRICEKDCVGLESMKCPKFKSVCSSGCFCPAKMVKKGKKCVTRRECRSCKCSGSTDGSHETLDGQAFKFKGKCTYVALRDKNNNMRIYVTYIDCFDDDEETLCTLVLRIKAVGAKDIIITKSEESTAVMFGKRYVDLPYKGKLVRMQGIPGGVQVFIKEIGLEASVFEDLDYPEIQTFKINIPPSLYKMKKNPTEGLCGICTGPGAKGKTLRLKTRTRGFTSSIKKYTQSWLAVLTSRYYAKEKQCKIPTPPPPCNTNNRMEKKICTVLLKLKLTSFKKCDVDTAEYMQKCRELICTVNTVSEKKKIGCRIVGEYAAKCCENGRRIRKWRKVAGCPRITCKGGQRYRVCGPGCFKTCEKPKCPRQTRRSEGCYCSSRKLWNGVRCVRKTGCKTCGGHRIGEKWIDFSKCWKCHCKGLKKTVCQRLCHKNVKKCKWDQKMMVTMKGCCKKCVCRRPCPKMKRPKCKPGEVISAVVSPCRCMKYICRCAPRTCPRKPTCTSAQRLRTHYVRKRCCPVHECVCLGAKYCKRVKVKQCKKGRYPETVYDKIGCCVIGYKCKCDPCKKAKRPKCRRDQKVVTKKSKCKCNKYTCKCKKCPRRPVCGRYSDLYTYKVVNSCCPVYQCRCNRRRCPKIRPNSKKCKGDRVIQGKWDPSRCCVEKYICICPKCNKRPKVPRCGPNERVKKIKTVCGCKKYKCECNARTCAAVPKCSKFQVRRKIASDEKSSCCDLYECVCAGLKKCPKVRQPICKKYMRIKETTDRKGCCIVKKRCICDRSKCPRLPICGKGRKLRVYRRNCGCREGACVCNKRVCRKKRCPKYQRAVNVRFGKCCPKQRCECLPSNKCPRVNLSKLKCTKEQRVEARYDPARCCLTHYKCVCNPCKKVKWKLCKKYQREAIKISKCGCLKIRCRCAPNKCPKRRKYCGRFTKRVTYYRTKKSCCKKTRCQCITRRCPVIRRKPKCHDEQVRVRILDRNKCCIIGYRCKCRRNLKCPDVSFKQCNVGARLAHIKSACGCAKVICECRKKNCPRKPKCKGHQILRVRKTDTCCKFYECTCPGLQNCPKVRTPRCGREKVQKEKYDRHGCCIIQKTCVCKRCPVIVPPNCKSYQRLKSIRTKCCNYVKCVCDRSKCPKKRCSKHQKLQQTYIRGKCCFRQRCVCNARSCPKQRKFSNRDCRKGQVLSSKLTKDRCCRKFFCKCPLCRIRNLPYCKRHEKVVKKNLPCNCFKYKCVCDKRRCRKPKKCGKYEKREKFIRKNKCCPNYQCVCDSRRCKAIKPNRKLCVDEQKLVPVRDPKKCCIIGYVCKCKRCKRPAIPKCKKFERVSFYKSACGCSKPICKCKDHIRCPKVPVCTKYQRLAISKMSNSCCKRFECVCKGASFCPKIKTPKCKGEEIIKAKYDRRNCCEIKRKCRCPVGMCRRPKVPRCNRFQRLKRVNTKCCHKYKCVCVPRRCRKKRCTKYQTLTSFRIYRKCCPMTLCRCDPRKCPRPPAPKQCPKGMKPVVVKDRKKCCLLYYKCACRRCPRRKPSNCRTDQKIVVKRTRCGCKQFDCKCEKRLCRPKKDCGPYRALKVFKFKKACCPRFFCVCKKSKCPKKIRNPRCSGEEKSVPIYDKKRCCIIANTCVCKKPCKRYKRPACKSFERVKYKRSKCGCRVPECVCNKRRRCDPIPRCRKHEHLVKSGRSDKCCKRYRCVCKGIRYCKKVKKPRCSKEQKVVEVYGKCCIKRKYCKCKRCKRRAVPRCGKYKALRRKVTRCCVRYTCKCVRSRCPIKFCPKYHKKIAFVEDKNCCPTVRCVCQREKCRKRSAKLKCPGDKVVQEILDRNRCCSKYRCGCNACKPPKRIKCKIDEKVTVKRTLCRCPKYKCVCNRAKCQRRPRCGKNTRLKVTQEARKCCPTYECRCIDRSKCPKRKANPRLCSREQYLQPVYDPLRCCIERWKCVCSRCQPKRTPRCKKSQKLIYEKSRCNCPKPRCVCKDNSKCKPKPRCSKYQMLITSVSANPCCRRYECVCKGLSACPKLPPIKCKGEKILKQYTDKNDCCVVKRKCRCPKKCKKVKSPTCKKGERVVMKPTACCLKKICDCDTSTCKRKKCSKCMKAIPVAVKGRCCPKYVCACDSKCCRRNTVNPGKCKDEQVLKPLYDKNNCCVKRYKCVCSKCKIPYRPRCGRFKKLITYLSHCRCRKYKCVCKRSACRPPPTCEMYEKLKVFKRGNACCPEYICVCNMKKCPRNPRQPQCRDEQRMTAIADKKGCCLIKYQCKCRKCKRRKYPACERYQKVRINRSVCGCRKYECVCHRRKCPPIPQCTRFQKLKTYRTKSCCKIHVCVCKRLDKCPPTRTPKCKGEKVVKERVDKNGCCVVRRTCKCPKKCPKPKNVTCTADKKSVTVSTVCCTKKVCLCDLSKCSNRPRCQKFEKLRKFNIKGKCCPVFECRPPKGCVVMDKKTRQYLLKKKNATWKENPCRSCQCRMPAGGFEAHCTNKVCKKCPKGFKLMKRKGKCCGKCVQKKCVMGKGKQALLLKVGQKMNNTCSSIVCQKRKGTFGIKVTKKACPKVPFCPKGIIPKKDKCNCKACKIATCGKPKKINPKVTVRLIKVKTDKGIVCVNKENIYGLKKCDGTCRPGAMKSNEKRDVVTTCRSKRTKAIKVTLTCPNGETILQYVKVPTACKCQKTCVCKP